MLKTESSKIMSLLEQQSCFQKAHVILMYHSLPDEPNTHLFLEKWYKEKVILLPVVVNDHLVIKEYKGMDKMTPGAFGILEPQGGAFHELDAIELAVVPGMAFDASCRRLGRGKGYYDRLFSDERIKQVYKMGVCFHFQKVPLVPVDVHDVLMDEILG